MDKEVLAAWLEEGRSLEWIAREVGKSASTVAYWARKFGLESEHREKHRARGGLDREQLEELVAADLTVREIAERVERSTATVRHWLKRYGLETTATARRRKHRGVPQTRFEATCATHGTTTFVVRNDGGTACLRCRSDRVTKRRRELKRLLVAEAGGACLLCGYERCLAALEFHHIDRQTKRFHLGLRGLTRSLPRLRSEAAKCVLLCSNCHVEVESGVAKLTDVAAEYLR